MSSKNHVEIGYGLNLDRSGLVKCHFAGAGFDMVAHMLNEGFAETLHYQAVQI